MWITSMEQLWPYLWNTMVQTGFTLIPALATIPAFLMGVSLFLALNEGVSAIEGAPPPRTFGDVAVRSHMLGDLQDAALCVYLPCGVTYYAVYGPLMDLLPKPIENPDWSNHPLARGFEFFLLSSFVVLAAAVVLVLATFAWLCYRASQVEAGSILRAAFRGNWLMGAAVIPIGIAILNSLLQNFVFLAMLVYPPPAEILHASYPVVWKIIPVFMASMFLGALVLLPLPAVWLGVRSMRVQLGYLALPVAAPLGALVSLGLLATISLIALGLFMWVTRWSA